jgi:hypothetical protein
MRGNKSPAPPVLTASRGGELNPRKLKKTPLKPHQKECRCIPAKENAAFVACMEDVVKYG